MLLTTLENLERKNIYGASNYSNRSSSQGFWKIIEMKKSLNLISLLVQDCYLNG